MTNERGTGKPKHGYRHEIQIPAKGKALLKANPEGLLSALRCFYVVTPRGHAQVANTFGDLYALEKDGFLYVGAA